MNVSQNIALPRFTKCWAKLAPVVALAILCGLASGCFRVSGDLRALRDGVMKSAAAEWEEDIEIGVGTLTLSVARAGLSFLDLPEEARAILNAAGGAEVGVYHLNKERKQVNRAAMLAASDKALTRAGWDRTVTVMDHDNLVAVYVPESMNSTRNVRVCVLVFDSRQLVLASARSNLEPLLKLALDRADWTHNGNFAFKF